MVSDKRLILGVDDEPRLRLLIEESLEDLKVYGVKLVFARNGEDALALIQGKIPRLVFLDVMMPRMSGFEVCRIIKKDLQLPVYIVLLTAKGQYFDTQKGIDVGCDEYIVKPYDPQTILDIAFRVLEIR